VLILTFCNVKEQDGCHFTDSLMVVTNTVLQLDT